MFHDDAGCGGNEEDETVVLVVKMMVMIIEEEEDGADNFLWSGQRFRALARVSKSSHQHTID